MPLMSICSNVNLLGSHYTSTNTLSLPPLSSSLRRARLRCLGFQTTCYWTGADQERRRDLPSVALAPARSAVCVCVCRVNVWRGSPVEVAAHAALAEPSSLVLLESKQDQKQWSCLHACKGRSSRAGRAEQGEKSRRTLRPKTAPSRRAVHPKAALDVPWDPRVEPTTWPRWCRPIGRCAGTVPPGNYSPLRYGRRPHRQYMPYLSDSKGGQGSTDGYRQCATDSGRFS